jgi:hypothetical protein
MITTKIRFALMVGLSLMSSATIGGTASSAEHSSIVSADELFTVFVDLRSSVKFDQSIAQYENPRFYSRAWLEDAIQSALNAAKQPDRPGLNWIQDSLLAKLSISLSVQSVYAYEVVKPGPNYAGLRMHVTDACKRTTSIPSRHFRLSH